VTDVDVVVVGAGFAGLYSLQHLRAAGWTVQGFEAGDGVGGTWYWNRYPGARCDVPSLEYSYSFDADLEQEWEWTERYASQPEILRYLEHVADRFDLRPLIRFGTRVEAAHFDEAASEWKVSTDDGASIRCRFLVMAGGCLSTTHAPDIPGLDEFQGRVLHTGQWPHDGVELAGQRIGIIGTGSSAIQAIPMLAETAAVLHVFQRTPNFSVPAHNRPLDPEEQQCVKASYPSMRAANRRMPGAQGAEDRPLGVSVFSLDESEREDELRRRWEAGGPGFLGTFTDVLIDERANAVVADFVRERIREIVRDPALADLLSPTHFFGGKRPCFDSDYFETYNRPNVHLVDISAKPIAGATKHGLVAGERHYDLDAIVLATGFDAMTGTMLAVDFVGREGATLRESWAAGPRTFLGLGIDGFPNLFVVAGPGSPSVLSNMVMAIEQHVEWIGECLDHLRLEGYATIEATPSAVDEWVAKVNMIADLTLLPRCNSWYLGANVPGKPRVFMPVPGFPQYADTCAAVAADGYRGFILARA